MSRCHSAFLKSRCHRKLQLRWISCSSHGSALCLSCLSSPQASSFSHLPPWSLLPTLFFHCTSPPKAAAINCHRPGGSKTEELYFLAVWTKCMSSECHGPGLSLMSSGHNLSLRNLLALHGLKMHRSVSVATQHSPVCIWVSFKDTVVLN